jgi:hypothetical protein
MGEWINSLPSLEWDNIAHLGSFSIKKPEFILAFWLL